MGKDSEHAIRLIWYQRHDGLWNADCTCGATIAGISDSLRLAAEAWHFERADDDRALGNEYKPCGPKMPEPDLNNYFPSPTRFR